MSENQYIPSIEEVTRMRHETGAGHGTSKEALIRARGDWTDARRIIRYSGTVKLGAVLREIDAKRADNMNAKIAELQTALTAATKRAEAAEAERWKWYDRAVKEHVRRVSAEAAGASADAEADALRAERDALRKDAARLDYLADQPVFEGFADSPLDVFELESIVAEQNGRSEPTQADRREAFRRMIDAAMAVQPTTGGGDE